MDLDEHNGTILLSQTFGTFFDVFRFFFSFTKAKQNSGPKAKSKISIRILWALNHFHLLWMFSPFFYSIPVFVNIDGYFTIELVSQESNNNNIYPNHLSQVRKKQQKTRTNLIWKFAATPNITNVSQIKKQHWMVNLA